VDSRSREKQWATWLRAAIADDSSSYDRFLKDVTPYLRSMARRFAFGSAPGSEVEDFVQEMLLALHLKRSSWDQNRPIGPWVSTVARNKMIDVLRRRGRHTNVPIEDFADILVSDESDRDIIRGELIDLVMRLKEPQRSIVQALSIQDVSIRDAAAHFGMSEGAISVALHRAIKAMAAMYRSDMR
jgi:RNA polymerase sigma factor (sigma-70 family)